MKHIKSLTPNRLYYFMKNLKNALLLKQLYQLKNLVYRYTDITIFKDDNLNLKLPHNIKELEKQAKECHLCELSKSRHSIVFGDGSLDAKLMIVGDFPSNSDDSSGKIFTGRYGDILDKMLQNVLNLKREDVYITNILKCRALDTKTPSTSYTHTCFPYLLKEIEIIKPKIILTFGELAYSFLSNDNTSMEKIHGIALKRDSYTLIPTYHPSYMLRNPSIKKDLFEDLKKLKTLLV